jgi:tetratricopeptide (TPR) repeat protein
MEHRLYSAMFGLALALAWLARELYRWAEPRGGKLIIILLFFSLLCAMSWLTVQRNSYFKDPLTLWLVSVRQNPDNEQVRGNLGATLVDLGQYQAGEKELKYSIQLAPDNPVNRYNLGYLYLITGREEPGIVEMKRAVELDPKYLKAHYNLGIYALNHGDRRTAVEKMELILRLNPHFTPAQEMLKKLQAK